MNTPQEHTPRPWRYDPLVYVIFGGPDRKKIASIGNKRLPTADANGRLIAAAPELLTALKSIRTMEMVRMMPDDAPFKEALNEIIDRAVAKAEGTNQ